MTCVKVGHVHSVAAVTACFVCPGQEGRLIFFVRGHFLVRVCARIIGRDTISPQVASAGNTIKILHYQIALPWRHRASGSLPWVRQAVQARTSTVSLAFGQWIPKLRAMVQILQTLLTEAVQQYTLAASCYVIICDCTTAVKCTWELYNITGVAYFDRPP